MPAVKKLKSDGLENGNSPTTIKTPTTDDQPYINAKTFYSFCLRPKRGLDRYNFVNYKNEKKSWKIF